MACLWLVKNGVPYDVAFCMDDDERMAHVIIFGQMEGNLWDWDRRCWKDRK